MRYAVVGAGIAGLAAAWELTCAEPAAEVTVYDPAPVGGKLRTSTFAGRQVDEGADAFLARVPWGRELCDELGLGAELVSPATGKAYIAVDGALQPLPAGLVLGVPTDAALLDRAALVSPETIARVAAEPTCPGEPLRSGVDVSVGELVRRRLGDEVLERLVDPLIGGINAGDSDRLSLRAAAPLIAEAAERSGSLLVGLREAPVATPGPVFWAHPGGMRTIVSALEEALVARGTRFDREVIADLADLRADGVVLAVPAYAAGALVGGEAADLLHTIGHSSPVVVSMAFARNEVGHALDASGFLVPRDERRLLTACSFATTKWAHLDTDPESVLLRASAGRYGDDRAIGLDDDELLEQMLADLDVLLTLRGAPLEVRISRWPNGFPQYEPGHLDRVAAIEADVAARLPHVRLAGAAYHGIGVPACIRSGREAARSLTLA